MLKSSGSFLALVAFVAGCCGSSAPSGEPAPEPAPPVVSDQPAFPGPVPMPDGLPAPSPGDVPGPHFGANPFMTSGGVPDVPAENLREDLEATPDWFRPRDERLGPVAQSHRSTVPQLTERLVLFTEMAPLTADDFDGLMACRFDLFGSRRWDVRGLFNRNTNPDVTLKITGGLLPRITIRGPENTTSFVATIPHVGLKSGNHVKFRAIDRDVARDDPMGRGEARFKGSFPFTARNEHFMIECRGASLEWAEQQSGDLLPGIDHGIGRLEKARVPDMLSSTVDPAVGELPRVQRTLQKVAAYVGFGHASVIERVKRLDVVLERWQEARREQLEKMASAPPPGTAVSVSKQLEVKVLGYTCDPAELEPYRTKVPMSPCLIRLEAKYMSIPPRPGSTRRFNAKLFTTAGRQYRVRHVDWVRAGVSEDPAPRVRQEGNMLTVLATDANMTTMLDSDRPLLLWIEQGGSAQLLRLE